MNINKVAVLTAAGTGMGAESAKKLASDGFKISILSSSGKGEALANELHGIGVTGSNQSNEDIKKLIDKTVNKWGRIDVLVNSAGHGPRAPILELSDDDWFKGMNTYFMNVVRFGQLEGIFRAAPAVAADEQISSDGLSFKWLISDNIFAGFVFL